MKILKSCNTGYSKVIYRLSQDKTGKIGEPDECKIIYQGKKETKNIVIIQDIDSKPRPCIYLFLYNSTLTADEIYCQRRPQGVRWNIPHPKQKDCCRKNDVIFQDCIKFQIFQEIGIKKCLKINEILYRDFYVNPKGFLKAFNS